MKADRSKLDQHTKGGKVLYCQNKEGKCGEPGSKSPVKPELTYFSNSLPRRILDVSKAIDENCDLMIIVGNALDVTPLKNLMHIVDGLEVCPIAYINT